jgi:hypothetical protein
VTPILRTRCSPKEEEQEGGGGEEEKQQLRGGGGEEEQGGGEEEVGGVVVVVVVIRMVRTHKRTPKPLCGHEGGTVLWKKGVNKDREVIENRPYLII